MSPLTKFLRITALVVALGAVGFWAGKGAHPGWSMNQVPVTLVDEITGIEYTEYEQRFVPGIEFLGGGLFCGAALFSLSLLTSRKTKPPQS